jgi:hypothetical protein
MNHLVWRQHRNQAIVAGGLLGVLAVVFLITGMHAFHIYDSAITVCTANGTCGQLGDLFHNYIVLIDLVGLSVAVPALLGLFWGAPLVAREIEQGTHALVWTQSVTRRRWLAVKLSWMLAAAAVWGAGIGMLVNWWSGPLNSLDHYRFEVGHFDTQGLVPMGYSVFAVALGIAAGLVARRVLPAVAATIGGYVGLRVVIAYYLRPHYMTALTNTVPFGQDEHIAGGSFWALSRTMIDPAGHPMDGFRINLSNLPGNCGDLVRQGQVGQGQVVRCLGAHGYRIVTSYQPANRFWSFQLIETGIYLGLAAVLVALTFYLINRRDA